MKYTYEELLKHEFCGAKTRAGTPCKQRAIYWNGRCKFHGGLSTGPRTPEGKTRSAMNGHCPKKKPST
ncbi:HGGxSTG domain-containing protein [Thiolapillus sp.]